MHLLCSAQAFLERLDPETSNKTDLQIHHHVPEYDQVDSLKSISKAPLWLTAIDKFMVS
jgi:hypothetical protein